jgi:hypothetical protein
MVDKIIISHSLTSMDKKDVYTINASEVKVYKTMRKLLKILPASILSFALGKLVLKKLSLKSGDKDTKHMVGLCKTDMKNLTKQSFLVMADCMEDFLFNYTFSDEPYRNKPKKVLIIDSPTDTVANPMQRVEMLRLCPGANEYHFKTGRHITLLNCQEEYLEVLTRFFEDEE